jgi:hypothetical protein
MLQLGTWTPILDLRLFAASVRIVYYFIHSCIGRDRFACFMAKKTDTGDPFVLVRCLVDRQVGSDSMVI